MLQYFQNNYYTDAIGFGLAIVGLILPLYTKSKNKSLHIFRTYFGSYILLKLMGYATVALSNNKGIYPSFEFVSTYCDFCFTILEYFVFSFFLRQYVQANTWTIINSLFILTIFAILLRSSGNHWADTELLFTSQAILLIPLCISYFTNLLNTKIHLKLLNEPSFWVVTGVSFFMVCTLPYSLFIGYLRKNNVDLYIDLYSIFFVFYIILFSMIIKAQLCTPTE
jgi:hypothetical protein